MGVISIGANVGAATGVSITSHASADTFGNLVTLRAAGTGAPLVDRVSGSIKIVTGTSRDFVVRFVQGASDTELFRVPFRTSTAGGTEDFDFPVNIPANVAVKAQCMDSTGSGVVAVTLNGQEANALVPTGAPEAVLLTTQSGSQIRTQLDTGGTAFTFVSATLATTAQNFNAFKLRVRDATSGNVADALWKLKDDGTEFFAHGYKRLFNAAPVTVWPPTIYHDAASGSVLTVEGESSSTTINDLEFTLWGMALPTPSGSGVILQGAGMQRALKDGETTAEKKTISLNVVTAAGAHYNANGETARIKIGAGAWGNADNTVVGTSDGNELTLSDTEAGAASAGNVIRVYLPSSVNHLKSPEAVFEVTADDAYAASLTATQLAVENLLVSMGHRGHVVKVDGTDIVVTDTDGTTEIARQPFQRSATDVKSVISVGA